MKNDIRYFDSPNIKNLKLYNGIIFVEDYERETYF